MTASGNHVDWTAVNERLVLSLIRTFASSARPSLAVCRVWPIRPLAISRNTIDAGLLFASRRQGGAAPSCVHAKSIRVSFLIVHVDPHVFPTAHVNFVGEIISEIVVSSGYGSIDPLIDHIRASPSDSRGGSEQKLLEVVH